MHAHANARLTQRRRLRLVSQHLNGYRPLAELAQESGISLRCAYKWLVRVDQQLLRLHLTVTEGPVEGLDYQGGIHPLIQRPAVDTAAEQIVVVHLGLTMSGATSAQ